MATKSTCPKPMKATSNGIFQDDNPLDFALPLIILQICLVVVLTRVIAFFLKPLRQPRVIAEIIGGILLGPSALGRNKAYLHRVFPAKSITVLDTLANLGLIFFLFLVGLELDLRSIRRTGRKALMISIAGITFPFILGIGTSFVLKGTINKGVNEAPFLVFMGVAFSITAFPVLARILAELKLLTTEVGRLALSAAAVDDVVAWVLLALAIALSGKKSSPLVSLWVFLCGATFITLCAFVVPPVFRWMARRCPDGEPVSEIYVCGILTAVLAAAFVTDAIGIHALFGAFAIGALAPKEGPFAGALVEKVEDLVSSLFLPLYFVSSGLKTNVATIQGARSWGLLVLVIFTACFGKIAGIFTVSRLCKVPFVESVTLGFLMNTKGLVELIVLNIGKERGILNEQTFAIMVLMALFTTFVTTPLVVWVYKPAKLVRRAEYKHRTVQRVNPNTKLCILSCFHSSSHIPTIINLIEATRGVDKRDELCVYALHLKELSERSSAMLMVNKARRNGLPFWNKGANSNNNQIIVAFEAFRQLSKVCIRPMTAISPMNTMHEDICTSAERKRAAIIILPFHKQLRLDGVFETTRNDYRYVNKRVLEHAPCSVGILIDRALGGPSHISAQSVNAVFTVLFFGGPDDREALACGVRMAEHPGIMLKVVRFLLDPKISGEIVRLNIDHSFLSTPEERSADIEYLSEFKERTSKDESITYEERTVSDASETIEVIREHSRCNLFLVGRMPEGELVAALNTKGDSPELGPVASLLTLPDFETTASVLVVQQYHSQMSLHSLASLNECLDDHEEFPGRDSDTN